MPVLWNHKWIKFLLIITAQIVPVALWIMVAEGAEGGRLQPTEETSIGIFHIPDAPETRILWRKDDPVERLLLRGRVPTTGGAPVADAQVELWQADGVGRVHPDRYQTRLRSKANGGFGVSTALPGYIEDAPGVWGAGHIHVVVNHPNYQQLISLILFKGDPVRGRGGLDHGQGNPKRRAGFVHPGQRGTRRGWRRVSARCHFLYNHLMNCR